MTIAYQDYRGTPEEIEAAVELLHNYRDHEYRITGIELERATWMIVNQRLDQTAMEAAHRFTDDECEAFDNAVLANAYRVDCQQREADEKERAIPITLEWLRSLGLLMVPSGSSYFTTRGMFEISLVADNTLWIVSRHSPNDPISRCVNHGQVIDVLKGLRIDKESP